MTGPTLEERGSMEYRVSLVIQKDRHGYYAFLPEIEGCQIQGVSLDDVIEQMKANIKQYLEPCVSGSLRKLTA